jgi:hypothetical protein
MDAEHSWRVIEQQRLAVADLLAERRVGAPDQLSIVAGHMLITGDRSMQQCPSRHRGHVAGRLILPGQSGPGPEARCRPGWAHVVRSEASVQEESDDCS